MPFLSPIKTDSVLITPDNRIGNDKNLFIDRPFDDMTFKLKSTWTPVVLIFESKTPNANCKWVFQHVTA